MKAVLQRVSRASVSVAGETVGKIGQGLLVLLGVAPDDAEADADYLLAKIHKMRIFEDEAGKMNRSLLDVGGEMLVISQFTLFASYKKGNRPDYMGAASPELARRLYEYFIEKSRENQVITEHGVFGADMAVELLNCGPVTIVMDSKSPV